METLTQLFLPVSIWFQGVADWIRIFFQGVTFLGDTEFYILVMPALFWCINTALGIRIGVMLLVGGSLNSILKLSFQWPRPFWVSPQVSPVVEATGFGFPSGHAQNAAGIWGLVAVSVQKNWIRWTAIALIFLIGLSRIVLGVHFTHDVLVGWLVGGLLLWLFLKLEKPVADWFKGSSLGMQILALIILTVLLILPAVLLVPPFDPPPFPSGSTNPFSYDGLLTTTGSFLGLGLGIILLNQTGMFSQEGKVWQRIVRYPVGLVGVLLLYLGLGSVFPDDIDLISYLLRFFRYFLIGFWIAFGAPRVFSWLKLTQDRA
jgi:membrane-associated phospholipid phosphatase